MGTLTKLTQAPLDPVRARIVERAKELRYGLKDLSTRLNRNPSYIQQFIVKKSPRHLPEEIRHALAALLDIPEAELRGRPLGQADAPRATAGTTDRAAPSEPCSKRIPIYREDAGRLAPDAPPAAQLSVTDLASPDAGAVAVMLTEPRGLLQPRHILVCEPGQPVRPGDVVALVADQRLIGAGLLITATADAFSWTEGKATRDAKRPATAAWRVAMIRTQ